MKLLLLIFLFVFFALINFAQTTSSSIEVVTVYSQNENFFLKTIPYDNESPTLRGKTIVFEKGKTTPLYEFERGFDSVDNDKNNLILSNNGEIIFFVLDFNANEEKEGLKSITIYSKGKILKSFTLSEVTGCDLKKERCDLVYNNYWEIIDKEKSNLGTRNYKQVFKDGVSEQDKFLADFAVFNFENTVYLTDSKKQTHLFDLQNGNLIKSVSFESIFDEIKSKAKKTKTIETRYDVSNLFDFPKLKTGADVVQSLATFIGMKPFNIYSEKDEKFRQYGFEINVYLLQDGSIEIESEDIGEDLPKEKILEFFKNTKFDTKAMPKVFPKWHINEIFFLRKANVAIARKERQEQIVKERELLKQSLVAEKIGNIYIPKDLGDCFIELDKLLSEVDKNEMKSLPKRDDMIRYHMGLGMWMRNNWRLWGGSRLQKYFTDRKISHPDNMSSVILFYYHDWLTSKKETWKDWEKNPK